MGLLMFSWQPVELMALRLTGWHPTWRLAALTFSIQPACPALPRLLAPCIWARFQHLAIVGTVIGWLRIQVIAEKPGKAPTSAATFGIHLLRQTGLFLFSLSRTLSFTVSLVLLRWDDNILPTSAGALLRGDTSLFACVPPCSLPGAGWHRSNVPQSSALINRKTGPGNIKWARKDGARRSVQEGKRRRVRTKKTTGSQISFTGEERRKRCWRVIGDFLFIFFCRANWLTTAVALVTLAEVH